MQISDENKSRSTALCLRKILFSEIFEQLNIDRETFANFVPHLDQKLTYFSVLVMSRYLEGECKVNSAYFKGGGALGSNASSEGLQDFNFIQQAKGTCIDAVTS